MNRESAAAPELLLAGGRVVTPYRVLERGGVWIRGGKIAAVGPAADFAGVAGAGVRRIDCTGCIVAPGFVDIHVHGAGGGDTMAGTPEAVRALAAWHARGGTTSLLPTTLTASPEAIDRALAAVAQVMREEPRDRARVLGAHVEGPHINPEQAGAQNPAYVRGATAADIAFLTERAGCIRVVTAAPEIEGGLELGTALARAGIVASIGHSSALYPDVVRAAECGYRSVTHLFCAMRPWINVRGDKTAGLVESAFLLDELFVEVIADLNHVSAHLMQLVFKVKGADRVALVTDAMWATGLPPGPYKMGGLDIVVTPTSARLADDSANAGSVATMDACVRNAVLHAGVPLEAALRSASLTPATLIGASDRKGSLAPGKDGDVTVLTGDLQVRATIVGGRVVYERPQPA